MGSGCQAAGGKSRGHPRQPEASRQGYSGAMFEAITLLGSLLAVAIGLASAALIVWLGRSAPARMRRVSRGIAALIAANSLLYAYLALHYFHGYGEVHRSGSDILMPVVSLCASMTILAMILLTRDSLGDPLKLADLKKAAFTDALTGLPNRRSFDMAMDERMEIAIRRGQSMAVMMFDIDDFKKVNDIHGHEAGDEALRLIGKALRRGKRDTDMAFRFGGEEFTVIASASDLGQAVQAAERLRRLIAEMRIVRHGEVIALTTSVGVAVLRHDDDAASFLQRADAALYAAKRAGRNRVFVESCPVVKIHGARGRERARVGGARTIGS